MTFRRPDGPARPGITTWDRVPWRYRWIIIPFRELVWWPLRRFTWTFRCRLGMHLYEDGRIYSQHRGLMRFCDRCGKMRWEREA